jgi:hypothetical protein
LSEIRATTISDSAGTGPITLTGQSAAKAYVRANGAAVVQDSQSFNISSSTDQGGGDYTHSLSSSLDALGVQTAAARRNANGAMASPNESRDGSGTIAVRSFNTSGAALDSRHTAILMGDLA